MREKWIVSLSDGQTFKEDELLNKNPSVSAWTQLKEYLQENSNKKITSIQIIIGGYIYNTPHIINKKNTKFANDGNPDRLWFHKKIDMVFMRGTGQNSYYGFSYRVANYRHYLWINVKNNEVFCEIKDIDKRNQEKNIELFYDEVSSECDI